MTHPFTLVDCGLSSGTNKIYKSYIIIDIKMTQYCVCPFTMSNAMWPQATSNCAKKNFFFGLVIYLTTLDFILMLNYIGLNFILRIQAVFIFGDLNTC